MLSSSVVSTTCGRFGQLGDYIIEVESALQLGTGLASSAILVEPDELILARKANSDPIVKLMCFSIFENNCVVLPPCVSVLLSPPLYMQVAESNTLMNH